MPAVRLATEEDIPAVAALLAEFRDFWGRGEPAGEAIALYESLGFSSWFDPPGGRNLNLRLPL